MDHEETEEMCNQLSNLGKVKDLSDRSVTHVQLINKDDIESELKNMDKNKKWNINQNQLSILICSKPYGSIRVIYIVYINCNFNLRHS